MPAIMSSPSSKESASTVILEFENEADFVNAINTTLLELQLTISLNVLTYASECPFPFAYEAVFFFAL